MRKAVSCLFAASLVLSSYAQVKLFIGRQFEVAARFPVIQVYAKFGTV